MRQGRRFAGYRHAVPAVRWPGDAKLAVSFVVNIEEGAELSLGYGDEANEFIYEAVEQVVGIPDLCMESHFEYGPRAGWPRLRRILGARAIPATISTCGRAAEATPWILEEAVADGHEISAHGWRWERHCNMDEATERQAISRTVETIARITGAPPVGWHTRSAPSLQTRALLVEQGGFLYDSDAYSDDIPFVLDTDAGPHVVLPYAFDTNDMRFLNRGGFTFAEDFSRYCIAAFDRLYAETAQDDVPRMLSIGLHPRIIGRPARTGGLEQVLDHIAATSGVWIATRAQIAAHWRRATGLPDWHSRPQPAAFAAPVAS